MNLKNISHAYFLGIGGIGMSAIARYLNSQGIIVCGYDKTPSDLTQALEDEGIRITFEDSIYTLPAWINSNPSSAVGARHSDAKCIAATHAQYLAFTSEAKYWA